MAKVLKQTVKEGALKILEKNGVNIERFTPSVVAQVPILSTGLLAKVMPDKIDFDDYNNPFIVTENNERIALAAIFVFQNKIFVYNRENKELQNLNEKLDVIGAVGFGVSSGPFKWPVEMTMSKIKSVRFSDFYAEEITDSKDDKKIVLMPIVVIQLENINGLENHFINIPNESNENTAKLNAALRELNK